MKIKLPRDPQEVIEQARALEKLNDKASGQIVNELAQPIWNGTIDWHCLLHLTQSNNALARRVGISALSLLDFDRRELNAELERLCCDQDEHVRLDEKNACDLISYRYRKRGWGDPWDDH